MAEIRIQETATVPTPPAGYVTLFTRGDDTWQKDANGIETNLTATGLTAVNLGVTLAPGEVVITNDAGTDATIPLADAVNAGAAAPGVNDAALSAVQSVVAGANVTVDNTDPQNPIVSATDAVGVESVTGAAGVTVNNTDPANPIVSSPEAASAVQSVVAGDNVTVDNTDPQNPIVSSADSQIIYDGVDTAAAILALDPTALLGQTWWAFDTKTKYIAVTVAAGDVWQPLQLLYNALTDSYVTTPTQDGHMYDNGQEAFFPAANDTATGASALDPKVFESVGANVAVSEFQDVRLAVAGDLSEGSVFGLNTTSLLAGERGKIVTYGQVRNVNTSAWSLNDVLYVDTTAGELTSSQPEINAYIVGRVLKVGATDGIIFVQSLSSSRIDTAVLPVGVSFIYLTGETETTVAGTFYKQLIENEGTVATVTETATVTDDEKLGLTQDHIGDVLPADTTIFSGIRKAQLEFSVSSGAANEKLYLELYQADAVGNVVDSGLVTEPVGDLGVRPILTFETSLLNSDANDTYKPELRGLLSEDYVISAGTRTVTHVVVEKVGTAGGSKTFTVYFGSDHDSFLESVARITIDDVVGLPEALDDTLKPGGLWIEGTKLKNYVYRENGWAGWPIVDTEDHLEPQESGPEEGSIDTDSFPTASNVSVVTVTHKFTITEDCQTLALECSVPGWDADTVTQVVLHNVTTGQVEVIDNTIFNADGFTLIRAASSILLAGDVFQVQLSMYNSVPANAVDGGWLSDIAGGTAASQQFTLDGATTPTVFEVSHTDLDNDSRATELDGVVSGSIVRIFETGATARSIEFKVATVDTAPASSTRYTILAGSIINGAQAIRDSRTCTVHIDVPVTQPTTYGVRTGYYPAGAPSWATVDTTLQFDGVLQPSTTDGYAINVVAQPVVVSPDWFILASSDISTSGGEGVAATLQSAYDNGAQIETSTANGAVIFKRGTAADGDSVIEVRNAADGFAHGITGDGKILTTGTVYVGTAGVTNQGQFATTIGPFAGTTNQGVSAFAGGSGAGATNQGAGAIALGPNAGADSQGGNSIAIGNNVAPAAQGANGIILSTLNGANETTGGHVVISTLSCELRFTQASNTWTFGQNIAAPNFNYLGLNDTDDTSYAGKIGYVPIVNPAGTGLILADPATAGTGSQMETLPYVTANNQGALTQGVVLCTAITVTRGFVSNGLLIDIVSGSVAGDIEFGLYRISTVTPGDYELVSKARVTLDGNVNDQGVNEVDWDTTGVIEDGIHYVAILNPSGQASLNTNLRALNIAGGNLAAKFTSSQTGLTTMPAVINVGSGTANGYWAGLK